MLSVWSAMVVFIETSKGVSKLPTEVLSRPPSVKAKNIKVYNP